MSLIMKHFGLLSAMVALASVHPVNADDPPDDAQSKVLALKDLGPQHDGKEVTVILKITDTQLIAGEREGDYPHALLHYDGFRRPPYLAVYVKGELADALHRFACVAPDDRFVGRSIKASGKVMVYKDFSKGEDQRPIYHLELREWKKFQILPEPKERNQPLDPNG